MFYSETNVVSLPVIDSHNNKTFKMDKEKILALLVAKFPGVRKDALTVLARTIALQCADEKDAETIVNKITDAQVTDFTKEYRKDVDTEVTNATKTFETNLKEKFDFVAKNKPEPGGNEPNPKPNQVTDPNDIQALIKNAVAAAVAPLTEKLGAYEQKNIADTRLNRLNESLAKCKSESFKAQTLKDFARMTFKDDAEFDEYLNDKAKDIETANQSVANDTLHAGGGAPLFTQKDESGVSKAVEAFVKSHEPNTDTGLGGKEV